MRWLVMITCISMLAGCASQVTVRCDTRLRPINMPASKVGQASSSASTSSSAVAIKGESRGQ